MLSKKDVRDITSELDKNRDVYLQVNTGRYKGSICILNSIHNVYSWSYHDNQSHLKFMLSAPGLVRKLSMYSSSLTMTTASTTSLTAKPLVQKSQMLPRDFSNAPINTGDHLFGYGKLIKVLQILPNNYVETRCIKGSKKETDTIAVHRSLKSFIKIEDPTMIILRM